jgi:hypothetical protein
MGSRQAALETIVHKQFRTANHRKPSNNEFCESIHFPLVLETYKALGGKFSHPSCNIGRWDIEVENFIIELDEERHFNRYRLVTLSSRFYATNTHGFSLPQYKTYCSEKEDKCLKAASWGNNWKNNSTEKHFTESGVPGDLNLLGSSRWRQRAFYDFLKDIASSILTVPVIRISIYDSIKGNSVNQLLTSDPDNILLEYLAAKNT